MNSTFSSSKRRQSPGLYLEREGLHQGRHSNFPVTYVERDSGFRAFCPFTRALTVWTETAERQLYIGRDFPWHP